MLPPTCLQVKQCSPFIPGRQSVIHSERAFALLPPLFTLQGSLGKTFGYITRLLDEVGDDLIDAVHEREVRGDRIDACTLRIFLPLLVPEMRQRIPGLLKDSSLKLSDLKNKVADLTQDMWVDFHWNCSDPDAAIQASHRMIPSVPSVRVVDF